MAEKEPPISEVFALLAELALKNGAQSIKDLPDCYTLSIGEAFIAINGHADKRTAKVPDGGEIEVQPFCATMLWDGWPVYSGNPYSGCVICASEDELIRKIKTLFPAQ